MSELHWPTCTWSVNAGTLQELEALVNDYRVSTDAFSALTLLAWLGGMKVIRRVKDLSVCMLAVVI